MRKSHLLVAVVSTIFPASALAQGPPPPMLRMMGVVSEVGTSREYSFGSFEHVGLSTQATGLPPLPIYTKLPLMTPAGIVERFEVQKQAVKIEVLQYNPSTYKYNVLLGPKLNTTSSSSAVFPPSNKGSGWVSSFSAPLPGTYNESNQRVFHLQEGWAYAWTNPDLALARTDWFIGAAEGSSMIVEIVDSTKQRVYFEDGTKITVSCLLGSNTTTTANKEHFVEITLDSTGNCNFSTGWQNYSSSVPDFVTEARKMKDAAK